MNQEHFRFRVALQKGASVSLGDFSRGKGFADGGRKAKEPKSIGDGGAGLAHAQIRQ